MTSPTGSAFRVSGWVRLPLAVACVGVGAVLTVNPFESLEVLVALAGSACVLAGALTLTAPERRSRLGVAVAIAWVTVGVAIFLWPNLSVAALAVIVGIGLVVQGLVDLARVVRRTRPESDPVAMALEGLTALAFGIMALTWPDVTIFVVAVLFGARTVLYGLSQLVHLVRDLLRPHSDLAPDASATDAHPARHHGWRRAVSLTTRLAALALTLILLLVSTMVHRSAPATTDFYSAPAHIPARTGTLIRVRPYVGHNLPAESQAWLMIYSTKTTAGDPTVASAVVVASKDLPSGPRPVIAWDHGTVGIAPPCAPSLSADPFSSNVPALPQLLAKGWVMVATDYAGMGTAGVSPYLIGAGQAYSALDAVRAAHQLTQLDLSRDTVVWGHSQGGHAALWTGMLAPTYAPELQIDGVAAISPATDLVTMADAVQGHLGGSIVSAYVITAYADTYPDIDLDDYVRPGAVVQVRQAARHCITEVGALASIITTLPISQSVFSADVSSGATGKRLAQNTPTADVGAPLLVAQGTSDEVIPISITTDWVDQQCAAGRELDFISVPDRTHMTVLNDESPLPEQLIAWTQDRLDGNPPPNTCP